MALAAASSGFSGRRVHIRRLKSIERWRVRALGVENRRMRNFNGFRLSGETCAAARICGILDNLPTELCLERNTKLGLLPAGMEITSFVFVDIPTGSVASPGEVRDRL